MSYDWQDDDGAEDRNERAYDQALRARACTHCPKAILAYGEQLARLYYPHLFTQ